MRSKAFILDTGLSLSPSGNFDISLIDSSPESQERAIDRLALTKASWIGIAASITRPGLLDLCKLIQRASSGVPIFGYFDLSTESTASLAWLCTQDSLFEKVFFLPRNTTSDRPSSAISRVLEIHMVPDLAPGESGGSFGRFLSVQAWPLTLNDSQDGSLIKEEEVERAQIHKVLLVAGDALTLIIEDLRQRINEAVRMVPTSSHSTLASFKDLLDPILLWIWTFHSHPANRPTPDQPVGVASESRWRNLLVLLPRGIDAETRLTQMLADLTTEVPELSSVQLSGLFGGLPDEVDGKTQSDLEQKVIDADIDDLPIEIWKVAPRKDLGDLRDDLSKLCQNLLNLLASAVLRRRLLADFVRFVWEKDRPKGRSSRTTDSLQGLKAELRRSFQALQGERVVLILPTRVFSQEKREVLRSWAEKVLAKACEVLPTEEDKAWLYIETPIDPCRRAAEDGRESNSLKVEVEKNISEKPADGVAASARLPHAADKTCSDCGSSGPRPSFVFFDPGFQAAGKNGSSRKTPPPLTCPRCGRFNAKDWWLCWNHDKNPLPIPIDKDRCPDCILKHHEDPILFPLFRISVNPRLLDQEFPCLHCADLRRSNPYHERFIINKDLAPFYRNGVNGHDRDHFLNLAQQYRLVDDCRCPNCGTLLIPVDHREGRFVDRPCDEPAHPALL